MPSSDPNLPADRAIRDILEALDETTEGLSKFGFRDTERAFHNLEELARPGAFSGLPATLFRDLLVAPDPDLALNNFERISKAVFGKASFYRFLNDLPQSCSILVTILGSSQFLSDILVRDPELFYWLAESPGSLSETHSRESMEREFTAAVSRAASVDGQLNAIRRLLRKELLRIGAGDLIGHRSIGDVAGELSHLADLCLSSLIDIHTPEIDARFGQPRDRKGNRAEFAVVGLGKLGGGELNFSSDIDLMFVYSEEGQTDGDSGDTRQVTSGDTRQVTNNEYFTKLAERIVQSATEPTGEGFMYRIDLRLRPDGAAGALVMPLTAYESYYARRGELWERQMLIKARGAAGSADLGDRFIRMIQPFVYPGHFEISPFEEIHRIKGRIEAGITQRGKGESNLKLRPGGIRDIEFTVQGLQLLVGRLHPDVRCENTYRSINRLQWAGALSEQEAETLRNAYTFFRRLEHRLQMSHNLSTYDLPDAPEDLLPLARSLGLADAETYLEELEYHLAAVRTIYTSVFTRQGEGDGRSILSLAEVDLNDAGAEKMLENIGFQDPKEAHRNLIYLAFGHVPRMRGTRARQSFSRLAPSLLQSLQQSVDPDTALSNFERILTAYGAGNTFFQILESRPGFRDLILSLCDGSRYLAALIARNPGLIDWLTRPDVLLAKPDPEQLAEELNRKLSEATMDEAQAATLNAFKNRELLRIGTRDLVDLSDTFDTFNDLSVLAETILRSTYDICRTNVIAGRGIPLTESGEPAEYVVLGLGKFGGNELNYGSDLDLVFVYSEDGETDGEKPQRNIDFFINLSQQVLNTLGRSTPTGSLYPVDARLRPEGGNSLLALSYDRYDTYLERRALMWERLALSRCKVVAGDAAFGSRVLDRIEAFVMGDGLSSDDVDAIVDVRSRMEHQKGSGEGLAIKAGLGGIVDIEFIAQTLQIRSGDPALRSANTLEAIANLKAAGHLPPQDADALDANFRALRSVEKVLRRQDERAKTRLPADERSLNSLARAAKAGYASGETMVADLKERMEANRRIFEDQIGRP